MAPHARVPGRRGARLLRGLPLLLLLTGCGAEREDPTPPLPHWQTRTAREASWGPAPVDGGKAYAPLALPEARRARPDDDGGHGAESEGPSARFVLNEMADRQVFFKSYGFDFEEERDEAAAALQNMIGQLRKELFEQRRMAAPFDAEGASRVPVLLHVDRAVPWEDVRVLLAICLAPALRHERVQVAVAPVRRGEDRRVDLRVRAAASSGDAAGRTLRLERERERVGIHVGEHALEFPGGSAFEDEAFVTASNAAWARLEDTLPSEALGVVSLRTGTADTVPWAYVVKLLDILRARGCARVVLPDEAWELELLPHRDKP